MAASRRKMMAWSTTEQAGELTLRSVPVPRPRPAEVLVHIEACGVCRTDIHVIDRELPVHRPGVIPGHQVVGIIEEMGSHVTQLTTGQRVGVAWLHHTCGACRWCREGRENLCTASVYTGWDVNGGFAEYLTVPEAFAYPLPGLTVPATTAPLLCAGIIGYRALTRAQLPAGGALGIYGFGSSAHLTARLALAQGARIFAMTRGEENRDLARKIGAVFIGEAAEVPPEPLDAAIVFAPAGELVPAALQATLPGGAVVLAGIHMTDIPGMSYRQTLFHERDLRTVEANTRADGMAYLRLVHVLGISPTITRYPFAQTDVAVQALRDGMVSGSLVIGG